VEALSPALRIAPASDRIAVGRFRRDGREILLVLNAGREAYSGSLGCGERAAWQSLDPATGQVTEAASDGAGNPRLTLSGRQAVLLVKAP
jgi:hypothetical protein